MSEGLGELSGGDSTAEQHLIGVVRDRRPTRTGKYTCLPPEIFSEDCKISYRRVVPVSTPLLARVGLLFSIHFGRDLLDRGEKVYIMMHSSFP